MGDNAVMEATPERYGLFQLNKGESESNYDVDIVAVHGLGGDFKKTWTAPNTKVWLKDFLPKQLQESKINARIMSFGYDSSIFTSTSIGDIEDVARNLLAQLKYRGRSKPQDQRPIIFVTHSLGGIIALVIAREKDHYEPLLKSIRAILFFGVPHRGSSATFWPDLMARLTECCQLGFRTNRKFLSALKDNSNVFSEISRQFADRAGNLKLVSFYETSKTKGVLIVDKDSAVLTFPGEEVISIPANHQEICKFGSPESSSYEPVWRIIQDLSSINSDVADLKSAPAFLIPFGKDPDFVGRQTIIEKIDSKFEDGHQRVALDGLGGVGKSQIAIEYCYRYSARHPDHKIFWVHGSSASRFLQGYESIARNCQIPGFNSDSDTLQLVYEWLRNQANGKWLMILDSFDDHKISIKPQRVQSISRSDLQNDRVLLSRYLPQGLSGSILITSRNREAAFHVTAKMPAILNISYMSLEEAELLLDRKLPDDRSSQAERRRLLQLLDCVPLAITQAVAFISRRSEIERMSILRYTEELQSDDEILFEEFRDLQRDDEVPNSVIRTWYKSFEQIKRDTPSAARLFSLMCVFDRNGIPRFLVAGQYLNDLSFRNALQPLVDYSLISVELNFEIFAIHRLVHLAMSTWLERQDLRADFRGTALRLIIESFPSDIADRGKQTPENWDKCELLLPHVRIVCELDFPGREQLLAQANMRAETAEYLKIRGKLNEADDFITAALEILRSLLGEMDLNTLYTAKVAASIATDNVQYIKAEALLRPTLIRLERLQNEAGPGSETLSSCVVLQPTVIKYKEIQDWVGPYIGPQVKEYEAFTDSVRASLASVLLSLKKFDEAIDILRPLRLRREYTLGKMHDHTIYAMNELGRGLTYRGDFDEGRDVLTDAVTRSSVSHGDNAIETARSQRFLGELEGMAGNLAAAENLYRSVKETIHKIVPPQHPEALQSVTDLAIALDVQKQYEESNRLYRYAMKVYTDTLGKTHLLNLEIMARLSSSLRYQGEYNAARSLSRQLLYDTTTLTESEQPPLYARCWQIFIRTYPRRLRDPEVKEFAQQQLASCTDSGGESGGNTILTLHILTYIPGPDDEVLEIYSRLEKSINLASKRKDPYVYQVIRYIVNCAKVHGRGMDEVEWYEAQWEGASTYLPVREAIARAALGDESLLQDSA